jgi:hypothetical protein
MPCGWRNNNSPATGSHRDQGHGGQAGPLGLPHVALRDEIRGPRSGVLRSATPTVTDQAAQVESSQAGIPNRPNPGCLKSTSLRGEVDRIPQQGRVSDQSGGQRRLVQGSTVWLPDRNALPRSGRFPTTRCVPKVRLGSLS